MAQQQNWSLMTPREIEMARSNDTIVLYQQQLFELREQIKELKRRVADPPMQFAAQKVGEALLVKAQRLAINDPYVDV